MEFCQIFLQSGFRWHPADNNVQELGTKLLVNLEACILCPQLKTAPGQQLLASGYFTDRISCIKTDIDKKIHTAAQLNIHSSERQIDGNRRNLYGYMPALGKGG